MVKIYFNIYIKMYTILSKLYATAPIPIIDKIVYILIYILKYIYIPSPSGKMLESPKDWRGRRVDSRDGVA